MRNYVFGAMKKEKKTHTPTLPEFLKKCHSPIKVSELTKNRKQRKFYLNFNTKTRNNKNNQQAILIFRRFSN